MNMSPTPMSAPVPHARALRPGTFRGPRPARGATAATLVLCATLAGCGGSDGGGGGVGVLADPSDAPPGGPSGGPSGVAADGAPSGVPGPVPPGDGDAAFLRPDQVQIARASGSTETVVNAYDDALGLIAVQQRFVDATPSEERRYAYDADGRLTERRDRRGEGGELLRSVAFTYSPDGRLAALEYRDPEGLPTRRLGYEFDADGRVEIAGLVALADAEGVPLGPDGLLVERTVHVYAGGRLVGESIDDNGDGTIERTRDYVYLDDGRLESVTTTDAAGGTIAVETWRYAVGSCSRAWANSLFAHFCVERP